MSGLLQGAAYVPRRGCPNLPAARRKAATPRCLYN